MAATAAEVTINASPDLVWNTLADVGGVAAFLPGARASRMEGDVRSIEMANNTIMKERITSVDGAHRRLDYTVIEGLPFTIDASVEVAPDGGGARVSWGGQGIPEDQIAWMGGVYASGLQGLRAGLAILEPVLASGALAAYAPLHAAHADLLERAGDPIGAAAAWARAIAASENATRSAALERRVPSGWAARSHDE